MTINMKKYIISVLALAFLGLVGIGHAIAQNNTYTSVLSEHTWYRLAVTQEGAHQLDFATLQSMGIDMNGLNPNQIRLYGRPSGALPELNSTSRPDDLTEMAICVTGADDGRFDEGDKVLFYGQEPTRWVLVDNGNKTYRRERNYYTDTTYYYLCVDSGQDGMRIGEKATLPVEDATTIISEFPDFFWHEEELFSPFNFGQNWFGEMLSAESLTLSIPFEFPNLVNTKPLIVRSSVLGRVTDGNMYYDAWVADNHVADHVAILKKGNNDYGKISQFEKQVTLETDTASFLLSMTTHPSALLYLDYVEFFGWRQLKLTNGNFLFRLMPSQFGNEKSAVWVQNANADYRLWEVTSPLYPIVQKGVLSGGNLVFATNEHFEKRYVLFKPASAYAIKGWKLLPNQNVHAIAEADNLILTSSVFLEQAQALADYHSDFDGMTCVVVDVDEIYNEFSAGICDPTAIRDFVRMVYLRSSGQLKYLTLFGRASFDFRNLLGYNKNFVPTYETAENPQYELSFCSDDYFALMDDGEGVNCKGRVDIGVGRLPVSTVEEAENILKKIRHYNDIDATYGEWKTDLLLFTDDEQKSYVNYAEIYGTMLDTVCPDLTQKKLYCGAYQKVNTSSGAEIPGAHDDLLRAFDKGCLAVLYNGHGGVRGLTGDNVFTNADIISLSNFDRMPFVHTATCEFTKYDNPLLVSAGELMVLNPNGGSIALLTSCRPTIGSTNHRQTKALVPILGRRDQDGMPLRFGDIVRLTKSDNLNFDSQSAASLNVNIRYLFLGDPVLRFPMPQEYVKVLKVNGNSIGTTDDLSLHAMSMVTVEGRVEKEDGQIDTRFNGTLWVQFYDQKTKLKVLFDDNESRNVYFHDDVLYKGQVSVTAGKFSLSFQVPKDIKSGSGEPRFSFYAFDTIRGIDAMGKFSDLTLGGTDPSMMPDDQGPNISFYWNTPEFENGQSVERQGVLCADLYDAQGIYHYDFSIGRDIVLSSNHMAFNSLVLNDHYEPALNDFRRGRVTIPLSGLEPGTYEFTLKVWDTQDNASEADLWFVVDDDLFLSQVRNFPNPFSDETRITLTHEGEDGNFDVNIEIFDIMGRPVQRLFKRVSASNGVIEPILWNGCGYSGSPLSSGVYLYRLTLTDENGYFRTVSQRMVIQR